MLALLFVRSIVAFGNTIASRIAINASTIPAPIAVPRTVNFQAEAPGLVRIVVAVRHAVAHLDLVDDLARFALVSSEIGTWLVRGRVGHGRIGVPVGRFGRRTAVAVALVRTVETLFRLIAPRVSVHTGPVLAAVAVPGTDDIRT